jgi:hypothetical protein
MTSGGNWSRANEIQVMVGIIADQGAMLQGPVTLPSAPMLLKGECGYENLAS